MFRHCCFFLFRSRSTDSIQRRLVRFVEFFGRYRNEKSKQNDPEPNEGTCNRSGHRDSTAKKLVYGSAKISGEFDPETSHACPSK